MYHNAQTDTAGASSLPAQDVENGAVSRLESLRLTHLLRHVFRLFTHHCFG